MSAAAHLAPCALVFAREPVPGRVKTRLARGVGEARAAQVYEALLRDTVAAVRAVGAPLWIAFEPAGARAWFAELAQDARLVAQVEGDLGARMTAAFEAAFEAGHAGVVALGSDAPHLVDGPLRRALALLGEGRAAIGPSEDGGYHLLALSRAAPELLADIAWSSARVLAHTLERARAAELELELLERGFDVDEPADLERLRALLAAPDAPNCTATRSALGL
jgi:rSAM/selenodomain-associated transferase 1